MGIEYRTYQQIDKQKWDACIERSDNGLIYAYSFYLDAMAANWDALVLNDYETVMPLTWKKKYGIYYLYQPFFTASLGVFGNTISANLLNDFLKAIPNRFKYWDIYLNHANFYSLPGFKLYERMNYTLSLEDDYEKLYSNYRDNIKRNIKKAQQLNCVIKKNIPVIDIIELSKQQSKSFSAATSNDYERFTKLYQLLVTKHQAITYGVYTQQNELVASAAFFFSHNRAYYILVGNHPNGKTIGASHALINAFIKDYAGQNLILDFEGSDIRNLAFFYSSFGAVEEKYSGVKLNRLPFWMKWFKK